MQRHRVGQFLHFVLSLSSDSIVHCWLADSLSRLSVCLATLILSAAALSPPSVSKQSKLFHQLSCVLVNCVCVCLCVFLFLILYLDQ